jgi:beta-1,4-N-acetylglucosaminyltransferase
MKNLSVNILLVYGSGGHNEQMKRIYNRIVQYDQKSEFEFISFCDSDVKHVLTEQYYCMKSVTNKFSYIWMIIKFPNTAIRLILQLMKINQKHSVKAVISTGPGISILTALFFKLFTKAKVIHVETWSRFYSKSLTGRILYRLSDFFFVQNEELLKLYPKAIYRGRL